MNEKRYSLNELLIKRVEFLAIRDLPRESKDILTFIHWLLVQDERNLFSSLSQETECKVHDAKGGNYCVYCGYRPKLASPHLDRKIEPLEPIELAEFYQWREDMVEIGIQSKIIATVNELVERFNQLQEERKV